MERNFHQLTSIYSGFCFAQTVHQDKPGPKELDKAIRVGLHGKKAEKSRADLWWEFSVSSVTQSCPTLCNPMNQSTPGPPVHHQLPESTQTHVHQVGDAIQPSHPLSSPSPPAPNPSQHQGLFQWVNCSHDVAKILEFQLQHQSFQWTPRTDLL